MKKSWIGLLFIAALHHSLTKCGQTSLYLHLYYIYVLHLWTWDFIPTASYHWTHPVLVCDGQNRVWMKKENYSTFRVAVWEFAQKQIRRNISLHEGIENPRNEAMNEPNKSLNPNTPKTCRVNAMHQSEMISKERSVQVLEKVCFTGFSPLGRGRDQVYIFLHFKMLWCFGRKQQPDTWKGERD